MDNPSPAPDTGADPDPGTGTGTGTEPQPPSGPRVTREEMKNLGRLRRSVTDRHIAGVAGGLARHLDIDPLIVRVTLVVAALFGGAGLVAYVGAWVLVPEEGTDDQPLGLDQRNRSVALAGVGILALLCAVGDWAGAFWFPWPLAIVAAIIIWYHHRKGRTTTTGAGHTPAYGYGSPGDAAYDSTYDYLQTPESAYAGAPYGPPTYGQPGSYAPAPRQSRNPRRRGPKLFLFTLALVALAEGVLGVVDVAGGPVADSAYPALALGIIAAMLIVGSFWGRAGGLIALGLVAALVTAVATFDIAHPDERLVHAPVSAGEVRDSYDLGGGDLVLDLSGVSEVDALDGRDIVIDGIGGRVEVVVPDGMDVTVRTDLAAGASRVFDERRDGFEVNLDGFRDGGDEVPDLTLTIDLAVGEIIVREAA